jgi:heavy metal translocating P-type ATPase
VHAELKIINKAIHCDSCEVRIQKVLEDKPGIIKATADQMTQEVQIYYDEDQITLRDIKQNLFAAFLAFFLWTVVTWLVVGTFNIERALFSLLAVLVMGYPCALGMATPLAMIRGSGIAAQKGILLRSGEAFQVFKDINKVIFDKTGTLTIGKPQVVRVYTVANYSENDLLAKAASIELGSNHPLGKAIVNYVIKKKIELLPVNDFQTSVGHGVQGIINNKSILVGNYQFMNDNSINVDDLHDRIKELQNKGQTLIFISENKNPMGFISIGDRLKKESRMAIELLHKEGFETLIISGDNLLVTRTIANKLGVKEVLAEVLPHEKVLKIRELQLKGNRVAMVGDGINDAPALMQADIGIAIGAGTDIAIESADIILVTDDLKKILDAYHVGKSSYYKTLQNIILAFGFNAIGIGVAIFGIVHPIWAMIAMALSVSTVLINSFGGKSYIKAYRFKKKQISVH